MYNSRTVRLGKYLDEPTADDEIETAKNLAAAFGFIFELEMFNQEDRWLSIKITYPRDELFSNEFSSVVKFSPYIISTLSFTILTVSAHCSTKANRYAFHVYCRIWSYTSHIQPACIS